MLKRILFRAGASAMPVNIANKAIPPAMRANSFAWACPRTVQGIVATRAFSAPVGLDQALRKRMDDLADLFVEVNVIHWIKQPKCISFLENTLDLCGFIHLLFGKRATFSCNNSIQMLVLFAYTCRHGMKLKWRQNPRAPLITTMRLRQLLPQ